MSVTGGTVLARTVEKTQGLVSPPTEQGVIRTERQKVLELVDYKRKTSWSHNGKPPHCVNSDVCQEQGSKREAKLAHVTDVMKERFEDDCLLSAEPSWQPRSWIQKIKKSTARQQSSRASYKNHECWSHNLSSLQTYFSDKCFITALLQMQWRQIFVNVRAYVSYALKMTFLSVTVLPFLQICAPFNPNTITEKHKTSKTTAKRFSRLVTFPNRKHTYFPPYKVPNGDHREISVFPFQTTGITQINSLCWNILLPHKSLSRRTRCQIIGCAEWGRRWPEAIEQVRTASNI